MRACVFILANYVTPFVGVERNGVRFVLSTHESGGVGLPMFMRGHFNEEAVCGMLAALERHAGISTLEDLTILEVGANIGTETVSLLVRHGAKRILAIEPDAENLCFLRANLALNGVQDRVEIFEMALSDVNGTVVLESAEDNWGDHRVRVADPFGPDIRDEGQRVAAEVPARTLDSLADTGEIDLHGIDLVWMDAQGHEGHILDGAERIAEANIPIVTEYWPYGLRRVGSLDRFHALIAQHHNAIVDLREPAVALDAGRVAELADRYAAPKRGDPVAPCTDLLLLPR